MNRPAAILLFLCAALAVSLADRDYYKILGISRSAGLKEIKAKYRKMSLKYHPDKNGDPNAYEKFTDVANGAIIF